MSEKQLHGDDGPPELPIDRVIELARQLATGTSDLGDLDPIPRARATEPLAALARSVIGGLAAVRREAFRQACDEGMTLTQIADALGVSPQAVSLTLRKRPDD
ncbi:helix-turn-helix domain-containing protein [Actinomadura rupiterrae]|uniref:helix-turn-helix domain-containing protein n=1 Tax=Actinomadura rupiterrae TaxID=559627 RepID=UPI0020A5EC6E|nr:helix-turn-helix domain-containing protein [Actinomadura rupiterrae]MCP2337912.1 DNA-directed RNA polymerase specialized sigma24 family protein [Actinomadura rupiterrae]